MKTPRLGKSNIEWLRNPDGTQGLAWNFYPGCEHWRSGVCPVGEDCWAKGLAERFKDSYEGGFAPKLYPEALLSPLGLKKPSVIGVNLMGDLFGDWVNPDMIVHPEDAYRPNKYTSEARNWSLNILIKQIITDLTQHAFLFLTKAPWNLHRWDPFPDNVWVGVSVCGGGMLDRAGYYLTQISAKNRFLSIEPLLERALAYFGKPGINWLIIGAMSGSKAALEKVNQEYPDLTLMPDGSKWTLQPKIEWVEEIVAAADKAGAPVFLKDNLKPLFRNGDLDSNGGFLYPAWAGTQISSVVREYRQQTPYIRKEN